MGISFVIAAVNALWLIRPATARRPVRYRAGGRRAAILSLLATFACEHTRHPHLLEPTQAVATLLQENLGVGSEAVGQQRNQAGRCLHPFSQLSSASRDRTRLHRSQTTWIASPSALADHHLARSSDGFRRHRSQFSGTRSAISPGRRTPPSSSTMSRWLPIRMAIPASITRPASFIPTEAMQAGTTRCTSFPSESTRPTSHSSSS